MSLAVCSFQASSFKGRADLGAETFQQLYSDNEDYCQSTRPCCHWISIASRLAGVGGGDSQAQFSALLAFRFDHVEREKWRIELTGRSLEVRFLDEHLHPRFSVSKDSRQA